MKIAQLFKFPFTVRKQAKNSSKNCINLFLYYYIIFYYISSECQQWMTQINVVFVHVKQRHRASMRPLKLMLLMHPLQVKCHHILQDQRSYVCVIKICNSMSSHSEKSRSLWLFILRYILFSVHGCLCNYLSDLCNFDGFNFKCFFVGMSEIWTISWRSRDDESYVLETPRRQFVLLITFKFYIIKQDWRSTTMLTTLWSCI